MANARSFLLAGITVALCAAAVPAAAEPAYSLRARGAYAQTLITLLSDLGGRDVVIGPEVEGGVEVDAQGDSLAGLQEEVARASGAESVAFRNLVVVGSASRIAAAKRHPLRRSLEAGAYDARKTTLKLHATRVRNLLRAIAADAKRSFEVEEGFEAVLTIHARDRPWTELLDAIAVAGDLAKGETHRRIRIWRRGYGTPRFSPLGPPGRGAIGIVYSTVEGPCQEPLGRFDLSALKVVAVISGVPEPVALVQTPARTQHELRRGACLGTAGAIATAIERDRVIVAEGAAEHVLALAED